ncbi:GntR family transcriptional regulator [Virgibacillus sp. W0430]|uniref:GntR family transcriptional regulator n=1 Tax=Virgibacillus sp. W0430 TaxID=3391580 RepID=UPI003F4796ED
MQIKKHPSLPDRIYEKLVELIQNGTWHVGERLASEKELASSLHVSRTALREALQRLELDGYIDRRHGVGTFVRNTESKLMAGLEELESMTTFIKKRGFQLGTTDVKVETIPASKEIEKFLQLNRGDRVTCFERVRTADSKAFAFDIAIAPVELLDAPFTANTNFESIFNYLEEEKQTHITHSNCTIYAENATVEIANKLNVTPGESLQVLEQIYFAKDAPLYYGKSYIRTDLLRFHIIRKRR